MQNLETRLEELRKQLFGEINRLEAMQEKQHVDSKHTMKKIESERKGDTSTQAGQIGEIKKNMQLM